MVLVPPSSATQTTGTLRVSDHKAFFRVIYCSKRLRSTISAPYLLVRERQ